MPTLPGKKRVSQALLGFDTATRLTAVKSKAFRTSGCYFCVRYVARTVTEKNNLTHSEAKNILDAGLALIIVQRYKPKLKPTKALGTSYGQAARTNAQNLGVPKGVSVFCDLEDIHPDATAAQIIAYLKAWHVEVATQYSPGLYVGANCGLTATQLYKNLPFNSYWRSAAKVPMPAPRGYQMVQSLDSKLHGIDVDFDIATIDSSGGRPSWLAPDVWPNNKPPR